VKHILIWLNHHQVFFSILVASIAIWQTVKTRRHKVATDHTVARVVSIPEVSAFLHSCSDIVKFLDKELVNWKNNTTSSYAKGHISSDAYTMKVPPELNLDLIPRLAALVEGSANSDKVFVSDFVSRIQIANSRLKSLKEQLSDPNSIVSDTAFLSRIIDLLVLDTCGIMILKYGRDPILKHFPKWPESISLSPIFNSTLLHDSRFNQLLDARKWPPKLISQKQRET